MSFLRISVEGRGSRSTGSSGSVSRARNRIRRALSPLIDVTRRYDPYVLSAHTRGIYLALAELMRRRQEPRGHTDLRASELSVFSQNGEDGVIDELLRRLGPGTETFVEFGCGAGFQANCVLLADVFGWQGLFMEADATKHAQLERKYLGNDRVSTIRAEVTADNVEALIDRAGLPPELDVLSIDIDGEDYWVWQTIGRYRPRIVVVEYNAALGPGRRMVQRRGLVPSGAGGFGASIAALRELGERKGYRLVHTDLTGVNAFFVRADLSIELDHEVVVHGANYGFTGSGPVVRDSASWYVDPRA